MAYCKKFIDGINLINFSDNSAELIRNTVLSYAYNELLKELEKIQADLKALPDSMSDNSEANELLSNYKKAQEAKCELIAGQIVSIQELVRVESLSKEKKIALEDEEFIKTFASKFRNIRHLADTLSDAPFEIKALQTRLYTEVLFKLDQAEQESQLQTLFSSNILDMIKEAVLFYNTAKDEQLRDQCHKLVQMGVYELVRSKAKKVALSSGHEPNYPEYQKFLSALNELLPDVGASSILDNLSDYRSTEGKSIANLLAEVEEKLNISDSTDWDKDEKMDVLVEKKFLFNRMRFGQEDRREYALKIQKNAARDLFWARGQIRDVEIFTESKVVNNLFSGLAERRYLQRDRQFKLLSGAPFYKRVEYSRAKAPREETAEKTQVKQKLEVTLATAIHRRVEFERNLYLMSALPDNLMDYRNSYLFIKKSEGQKRRSDTRELYYINNNGEREAVKVNDFTRFEQRINHLNPLKKKEISLSLTQIKDVITTNGGHIPAPLFPTGNRHNPIKERNDIEAAIDLIKNCLEDEFDRPIVEITESGKLRVHLFALTADSQAIAGALLDHIVEKKGFGSGAYTMLIGSDAISEKMACHTFTGNTLEEIGKQIISLHIPEDQRKKYLEDLNKVKEKVAQKEVTAISNIRVSDKKLNNSEQLLLSKLLELQFCYPYLKAKIEFPEKIRQAFDNITDGKYGIALKIVGLENEVDHVFDQLTTLDEKALPVPVKPIVEKAKLLASSSQERKEKLMRLEAAFASDEKTAVKVEKITEIFYQEYLEMAGTLKLTEADYERLHNDIQLMAEEMVCLSERTKQGLPALKEEEQAAYFSAIKEIAREIRPWTMAEVHFKIPHSDTSPLTVKISHRSGEEKEVILHLKNVKLPYSLIKPPGKEEFVFSYGGSRGVIAPFEGLDTAYVGEGKKKHRLFTHSRLLGVGQYSSVKEVEDLLTGLNKALKKGYIPSEKPTFTKTSRLDPRTRGLSSRNDSHFGIEFDVLQNLLKATKADSSEATERARLWTVDDKLRPEGRLYRATHKPVQYRILTTRAKGETFADTANKKLNQYAKNSMAYHDPTRRYTKEVQDPRDLMIFAQEENAHDLREMIALSQAVVAESARLAHLKFSHNDIKPENFLYKQNEDGSYQVQYIDWATGGFVRQYQGQETSVESLFAEIFGAGLKFTSDDNQCVDASGRFVIKDEKGNITFGVNPVLEILHGERNGTLPYISPKVLGPERTLRSVGGSKPVPALNTKLVANDPSLDDWALTAMTFGICNRQAYFALVKGRAVSDYIVPGILEADGQEPLGLAVVNNKNFNQFFACGDDLATDENMRSGEFYSKPDAVMYIPSNQREGEPMHLYRRLLQLKKDLEAQVKSAESPEVQIIEEVGRVLTTVHTAVASGEGLTKEQLTEQLHLAQRCLQNYEKLHDITYQQSKQKLEILQSILKEDEQGKTFSVYDLLQQTAGHSLLSVLCTYPSTMSQKKQAAEILDKAFDEHDFKDNFLAKHVPGRTLLKECIAQGQEEILLTLLSKVTQKNPAFIELVKQEALLHYAAEQGMTSVFNALIEAVQNAGATPEEAFGLLLDEYGPGRIEGVPHIKWATNCFHIAIRNNNAGQLAAILHILPPGNKNDKVIHQALHLCAIWGNKVFFNEILRKYNELNPSLPLSAKEIIGMAFPPDDLSPYHLFLQNESTSDIIAWDTLKEEPELSKKFLIPEQPVSPNPAAIAAANGNFSAVSRLIQLGKEINLSDSEWVQFFTQNDDNGKNLLNYIIEERQFDYLNEFIVTLKEIIPQESATVLVRLLSNPHPVNPLRNFLDSQTNPTQQFAVTESLLDAICSDYKKATEEQQRARIVALLMNQEWLIKQAENPFNPSLRRLLHNKALSSEAKQFLFEKLKEAAQPESRAKEFYTQLYSEVFAQEEEQTKTTRLDLSQVMTELTRQTSDVSGLIKALIGSHTKYKGQIKHYEEQLALLDEQSKKLRAELDSARESHEQVQQELQRRIEDTQKALDTEKEDKSGLQKTLEQLREESRVAKEQSEQTIEKLKVQYEGQLSKQTEQAKEELDLARETYEKAQQQLQRRIEDTQRALDTEKEDKSGLQKTLEQLREESRVAKEQAEQTIEKLKAHYEAQLSKQTEQAKEELDLARETYEKAQQQLQCRIEDTQKALDTEKEDKSGLQKTLEQLREESRVAKEQADETIEKLKAHYEAQLSKQTEQAKEELDLARETYEKAQQQLQRRIEDTQKALDTEKEDKSGLQKTLEQLREESRVAKEQADETIEKLKAHYEGQLSKQTEQAKEELDLARETYEKAQQQLQRRIEDTQRALDTEKEDKSGLQKTLEQLREESRVAKEQSEQTIEKLKAHYEAQLSKQTEQAKEELDLARETYEKAQQQLQCRIEDTQKALDTEKEDKSGLQKTLEQLREESRVAKEQSEQTIEKLKAHYEGQLSKQTEQAKEELDLARESHEQVQQQLQRRIEDTQKASDTEKEDKSGLQKTLEQLREESRVAKEQADETIEKLKVHYEGQLSKQTEQAKEELDLARETYEKAQQQLQRRIEDTQRALDTEKEDKSGLQKTLEQLREESRVAKEQSEQTIEKLKAHYEAQLSKQTEQAKEELDLARETYEKAQQQLQCRIEDTQKALDTEKEDKSGLQKTLEQLREESRVAKEQSEQTIEKLKAHYEGQLSKQTEQAKEELDLARESHEQVQQQLQRRIEDTQKALDTEKEDKSGLQKTLEQLREESRVAKGQADETIEKLKAHYEAQLSKQTEQAKEELDLARETYEKAQQQLQRRIEDTQKALDTEKEDKSGLQKTLEQLREESRVAKEQSEQTIEKLKAHYEAQLSKQDEERLQLQKQLEEKQRTIDVSTDSERKQKELTENYRKELEELRETLKRSEEEKRRLTEEMARREEQVTKREDTVTRREEKVIQQEQAVVRREETVTHREEELQRRSEDIVRREEDLRRRNEEMGRVEEDLRRRNEEMGRAEEDLRRRSEEMGRAEEDLRRRSEEMGRAEEDLRRRSEEMGRAEEDLRRRSEEMGRAEEDLRRRSEEMGRAEEDLRRRSEEMGRAEEDLRRRNEEMVRAEEDLRQRNEEINAREEELRQEARRLADIEGMGDNPVLAALIKEISRSKDDELLEQVRDAESNGELEDAGLNRKLVRALVEKTSYQKLIGPAQARLEELKHLREVRKARYLDPAQCKATLREDLEELRSAIRNLRDIRNLNKDAEPALRKLAAITPIHLFNPGFQAAAKKHADELGSYYEGLAAKSTPLFEYLKILRADLKDKLASLPTDFELEALGKDSPQKQAIQKRRHSLNVILKEIQSDLDLHEPLQKKFYGDRKANNSLLQQGILETLEQARSGEFNLKFTVFSSEYEDFDLDNKTNFLRGFVPKLKDKKATSLLVQDTSSHNYYRTIYDLKPGKGRLHTINSDNPKTVGTLLEEQQQTSFDSGVYKKPDPTKQQPIFKYTVLGFPQGSEDDPEVVTGRVQYAIATASLLLTRYGVPPTKEHPIPIDGSDPLQLKYIWTALIVLGQNMPEMKFDHHAVKVLDRTAFDPEAELKKELKLRKGFSGKGFYGKSSKFAENSFFETHFKIQPALKDYLAGAKEASSDKFGHHEAKAKTKKTLEKATQAFFAPESKRTVEKIEGELLKGIQRSH